MFGLLLYFLESLPGTNKFHNLHLIQICSGITRGRVLNEEIFAFVYRLFYEDFRRVERNLHEKEIFMKRSVTNANKLTSVIFVQPALI